ncbi:S-layer family protein [Mesorhizobium carmichaelinearum]|uniref:S-layer family protein n=1 Tax=Mesorhizobium carmichaelinearum TaxID=1208188 RepID=UPI00117BE41A|nr:S-layer family protein [Mesorhizobium carmichaelinearum]
MRAVHRRSRIVSHLWKTTALTTLALGLSGVVAHGDPDGLWQPQIRAIVGADNNGGNAALEGFIPIKQTAESVLFLDVRAKHDFKDASGQDIGLGIRRIVNPDLMLGGYAYLNVENYNSTQFTAGTLGVEAITPNFDAHVNVFVPIKGDSTDHSTSSTLSMVSNQLIEQISVLDHRDYAAWGIEGEIGAQVPINLPDKHSLRLDIGGYHFEDPHGDDGSVTGAKAGFEYTIGDVFGSGTELVLAGEVRDDNRDHTQFAGSVRLNIPFNPGHGSDTTGAIGGTDPVYPVSEGLRKRVNERVRGDIGVRIQSQDKTGGSTTRAAINAATNAAFGKFYFADGGLAGAGTQADPTTLDDAVTKAGSGGFIVALGGNGNIQTPGQTLAAGQTLIGGGESVTAKLFGGGTATFNLGGSDGTIQGTNVANNVITLGNGNTLNGITITGGADGIFGNNVTGTTLTNVTVTGAGGNGAEFKGNSTNVSASNFTATGNGLDGLHIEDNGTYNFTGTTLLQSNLDDGLDITGQGTYTFAIVNALDNTDRGITVQGTSTGGTFTTTGGTVSGNGGTAVFIDPITAHVVLDSITQTGGTSGVVLDHVSGSFTVNGATTISNTTGPAIAISDSPATIRFGDINITNPGADGMSFSGVNAAVVAGNIVISGLGVGTGLDFSGSQTNFTAQSLNISGPGAAGTIGIDLAGTIGGASIIITNGGSISGVDTGVRLGISGSLANSANAQFSFGGGSIAGITASLDARGLNQTLGLYAFGSTTFSGPQLFDVQNVIFIGSSATGSGDGSSLTNLATAATADAITDSDAIFVLVNDGTSIDASNGFSLSDGQTLASFGNGRSFSLGGVPINVTGANVQHDVAISDPAGAATLTNSGSGAVVTAANGNSLLDFNISGGSDAGISATSINGLTIQGVTVSNVDVGLFLGSVTGTVSVDNLNVQNASQNGIELVASSAIVNFTGNTTIGNATNAGLFANNFDGTATFDDLDITGGGIGVGIVNDSSGTLTFGAASSITNTGDFAFDINGSAPNVTYNGTINQATAANAVNISSMTGGTATFAGKITASTGAANAIDLTNNAGGAINFTGGLDLTTDGGFAFSAINGGTLTVTGSGNTVNTGAGLAEKGIQLGGAGGLTIGAAGVTFASVTVDGNGGNVATGIVIENTSGGNVTFGGVNISRVMGDAIRLTNVASGIYSFNGTTTIAAVGLLGDGFVVQGSAATVNVANLVTTEVAGADVSLTNNTGTIAIGGTITNSGFVGNDGVVVSGGTAAITVSADISSSTSTLGTAVKVDGISGGSVAFSGAINSTGTGSLFRIGSAAFLTGGTVSFTGPSLSATGGGGASAIDLIGTAKLNVTTPLSITNAMSTGLVVGSIGSTASATFGAVTVTGAGPGIAIADTAGSVTFGTTQVTLGSAANVAGINFSFTNADVSFGTTTVTMGAGANQSGISFATASADASFGATTVTMGAGANQTGINFSGAFATADFGVTTITGTGDLTSRGIDLSSTQADKTITFQAGSSITNVGVGVELSSSGTTATSANANFTFGDGNAGNGLQSSISAAAGGYTVNTIGLNPALGNYDFDDVAFTGSAHLASAVGGVIMVSQNGGVIAAGTDGLSAAVTTISVAAADALLGTQTFAFVGTVDLSGTPFTLDSGQSITGFGNNTSIVTSGTIQPVNVQGNLGATGGNVTGNEGVVTGTGDFLHLLGSNQVRNTAFDFSGALGSVFTVDQNAGGFNNAGGIFIDGVTVSNVAAGQTAFKVDNLTTNVSITNNNINVAGTLLDANGGTGNITVTRGNLPNSGPAGTLTGGGISIANRTGGLVNFTDKVTVGGNGVSLTNNTGATVTFADVDITTNGATAFSATGGGTVNVTTGTINATNAQAVALDSIAAAINFASTSATFAAGNGIDLQNVSGSASFGTGTLTNTGSGTSFNVGSATAASGGDATISYGGTIATNGAGAAVSIQSMTGGSVTLSGNLTDSNAVAGGNILIAGNHLATITFSGTTKQISSGTTDGVNIGYPGGFPSGTASPNTNSTIDFTGGGLDITTTTGAGFAAIGSAGAPSTVTVTGTGNKINSGGDGLLVSTTNVGAAGITFDSVSAVSTSTGAGVLLQTAVLAGDVNIGGLKDTGHVGAELAELSGAGVVNFTGTTDLDVSSKGFDIGGTQVGTINIANVAGSTLTIDGAQVGIQLATLAGTVNVGGNGGTASIGATTSTTGSAITLSGGNNAINATLNYNGSIKVDTGSVLQASGGDWTHLNMSGSVVSTTAVVLPGTGAFAFFGDADGVYNISSTINHTGTAVGVLFDGSSEGTVTFSGTSKIFNTAGGTNGAIVKDPSIGAGQGTGTLNFTNGGLVITTSSGAGFTASTFGAGTVSVTGSGNTITTTTGTALDLANATVGAGGVAFDSISVNGAATGVSLNNVSGGGIILGAVNLQGITSRGFDVAGTLGSPVSILGGLNIGLGAANAIGLDLNGAVISTGITAGDFDVDGGGFAGTIGIDMAGTTGAGTIQLGDTVNNNPAGQTSTIANVGYGVQFSSTTNAQLVFGDGQGPAESSIATTGGQVIHATDSLPTSGDYNFNDVNFTGDTANLASISVYYVTAGGTGDGSLANPGSYIGAQASTANVVVLIDQNVNGAQETIDLSGTTFNLDDGQVLLAFKSGDAAVDVSQLGVDASGGASAAFHFTTIQNTPIISAPAGIDSLRPVLQSNNATSVINFATSGTGTFTGGIENLIVRNLGTGAGVAVNATGASNFILRNNDIAAGGSALDFSTTGAPANTLLLSIDGNTLKSTGSALAATFSGQNINATDNSIAIRSFAGNKVTGGTGGGIAFNNVRFDSDGAGGTVSAGTLGVGNPGARVQGDGLSFTNTSGTLDLGTLSLANNGGTGVLVNTKGAGTIFTLNSSGGVVTTNNGAAFDLDPLTVNMTFTSVSSVNNPAANIANGIIFDGVAGTFTVTGATSITNTTGYGIDAINTNTGTFNFNTVTVNNAATTGGGIHVATGTLNVTGLANIDTTSGGGVFQEGGSTSFTGGLTIDTTSGDGFLGIAAGSITVSGTGNTITTATGRIISLQTAVIGAGGMTFNTLKATGTVSGGAGVQLAGVSGGAFNGGALSVAGASNNGLIVQNSTSSAINFDSVVVSSASANGIYVINTVTGPVTIGTVTIDNTVGAGVRVENTSGTVNINGGSIGATNDPTGSAVQVVGGAATLNVAASLTKTTAGKIVDISGVTGGTVTLSGALSANTASDNGIYVHGNTGGILNFNGAMTLGTGTNTAVNLDTNVGATVNFVGGMGITTSSGLGFGATGGGTINVTGTNTILTSLGGQILAWNGMTVGGSGATFSTLTAQTKVAGTSDAVNLTNVGGGIFNGGTLSVPGGTNSFGLFLSGTSATVNFAKVTIANQTGTATGGGIRIDNNTGAVTISDNTSAIGGFGAVQGIGIDINGGSGDVTIAASVSKGTVANNVVQISGRTAGTVTLSGTLSADQSVGTANGIDVSNNTGGTITFSGAGSALNTGTTTAVNLTNNTGATVNFTGGGLAITTTSAIGFNATGGGTINVTGAGNTIQTSSGQILTWNGVAVGASGVNFSSLQSTASVAGDAINLTGVTGGTFNGGAVSVAGTSAGGDGIEINGSSATFNFASATIAATAGNGILLSGANGAVIFTTVTIDNTTLAGIRIDNNTNAVNVNGGSIGATNDPTGVGVDINGGTGAVTIAASVTKTTAGNVVQVSGRTAGTVAFSGSLSATGAAANGIDVSGNSGTAVINFSGTKTLSTGANTAVNLASNTGATVNFTGGGLVINTTSGTGFNATGGGTVTVQGTGNTITSTTGTALNVVNTNIGSGNLVFQSISANGGTNGIVLNTTGAAGGLTVTGTGTTAGSGGTIQNTVQGALFTSTSNLSLSNMNFTNANSGDGTVNNIDTATFNSAAMAAINMSGVSTATFTNLAVVGNGGTGGAQVGINGQNVSNLTIANSTVTGFGDEVGEGNVKLWNLSGTSAVTNSTFGFVPGDSTGGENLFEIRNTTGTLTLNVTGSTFQNTRDSANGSGGIAITTTGTATATVNVSNSSFLNMKTSGFEGFAKQTSTLNVNITDGGTVGNGNTFDPTGTNQLSRAIGLNAQDTAHLTFNINRNKKIYGSGGPVINIYGQDSANIQGRIDGNGDIQNNNTAANSVGGPIFIHTTSTAATAAIEIMNNTIINNGGSPSIEADVVGQGGASDHGTMDITIVGNTLTFAGRNLTDVNTFNDGIYLSSGASNSDATIMTANIQNNTVTGITAQSGSVGLAIANSGGSGAFVYLEGFTTDGVTTWNNRGNTPAGSYVDIFNVNPVAAIPAGHNGGHTITPSNPNQ